MFSTARLRFNMSIPKLRADFNRLFSDVLCLSHSDVSVDERGKTVQLFPGMLVVAFDQDIDDDGRRDDLIASGVVERSPEWLACRGSKWILKIDSNGLRHESEIAAR